MGTRIIHQAIRKLPGKVIRLVPIPEPELVSGHGSRAGIGAFCRDKGFGQVLLVTDRTLHSLGYHEAVVRSLEEAGVGYSLFCGIDSEPNPVIIREGIKAARACGADCIVALGGGSVMDSSKMIAAGLKLGIANPRALMLKFLYVPGGTVPLVTVPSTAGTGAETTVGAVISGAGHTKSSTVIVGLDVRAVFMDSELTVNAPASITAACGLDALSHGLEGCLADVRSSDEDLRKSRECVRLVFANLPVVLSTPGDVKARLAMAEAAFYGGNAINKQLAGYVHAVAHALGSRYGIPHGNAIAMSLVPVLRCHTAAYVPALAELSVHCGFAKPEDSARTAAEAFITALDRLIKDSGLKLDGSVIRQQDTGLLVKLVAGDSVNYSAPVVLDRKEIRTILDNIIHNR